MSIALNPRFVTLGWPNLVYVSTLSSDDPGDWEAEFPMSAWLDPSGDTQGRSTSLIGVNAKGVFDRTRRVQQVNLNSHNLTIAGRWRYFLYSDAAWTVNVFTSDWIDAWPPIYSSAELNFEDPNWFTGQPLDEDRKKFTPLTVHIPTRGYLAQSWRIEIEDPTNADGYIECRPFISDVWQPLINRKWGAATNLQVTTGVQQNARGRRFYDVSTPLRTASFDYSRLTELEKNRLDQMKRDLGIHGELFYAMNLLPGVSRFKNTYIATLAQLNPITDPYADNWATRLDLLEKIYL